MIDAKIKDGDIVCDSTGRRLVVSDSDAVFQSAIISIVSKLGSFVYDRSLGSHLNELEVESDLAKEKAEIVINEALAGFENTYAEVLQLGESIKLKITINGESRTEEVRVSGNV